MAQLVKALTPDLRVLSSSPALGSIMGTEPIKEKKKKVMELPKTGKLKTSTKTVCQMKT